MNDLAGKRIAASGYGNLTSYEIQYVIDRYKLGSKTTIVSVISSTDRLLALQKGMADAAIISAPLDLKGEEMGLKALLHMGTILQIPQAGLATTDEKLKTKRSEVIEVLKAGIEGLTHVLAVEWADAGIRINAVAPGYTMTKRMEGTIASGLLDESQVTRLIPLRRFALPEEIARAVYFLGSPASSYVTGQTLYVDGGAVVNSHW